MKLNKEYKKLNKKINKLNDYITSENFSIDSIKERRLILEQFLIMENYSKILKERIKK